MKSAAGKLKNKIIWAFDPTQDPLAAKNIIKELETWSRHLQCEVQPLTIFSSDAFLYPLEITWPRNRGFQKHVQDISTQYLESAGSPFLPPLTLYASALSTRSLAVQMARYIDKKGVLMIFANTKAKKITGSFRLGGFAETLAASSKVPVLLLNRNAAASKKIPSVLFPTDFKQESKHNLQSLQILIQAFQSRLFLFNQIETQHVFPWEFDAKRQTVTQAKASRTRRVEALRLKKMHEWSKEIALTGVECIPLLKKQKNYLATEILEAARKNKVNLIALSTYHGPIAQAIMGSTARDVLLEAECPVLIFHHEAASKKAKGTGKSLKSQLQKKSLGRESEASTLN